MTIGDEIRTLRAALGENTATFGARWHKSGRTVENWEQSHRVPDAFVLAAIRTLAARTKKAQAMARENTSILQTALAIGQAIPAGDAVPLMMLMAAAVEMIEQPPSTHAVDPSASTPGTPTPRD